MTICCFRPMIAVALAAALSLGPAFGALIRPAGAEISGQVFDRDLVTPARGILVQATPDGARTPLAEQWTDQQGRFALRGLPVGGYVLLLSDRAGAPLAAARVIAGTGERAALTLALPEEGEGAPAAAGSAAPVKKGGLLTWISTPLGATVTMVVAAVVLSAAAHEMTDDAQAGERPPASPYVP